MKASQNTEGVYCLDDVNRWMVQFHRENQRNAVKLVVAWNVMEQLKWATSTGWPNDVMGILKMHGCDFTEDLTLPKNEIILS